MHARDAMINLLRMYREYAEDYTANDETDKTIALAIIALEKLKETENECNCGESV